MQRTQRPGDQVAQPTVTEVNDVKQRHFRFVNEQAPNDLKCYDDSVD